MTYVNSIMENDQYIKGRDQVCEHITQFFLAMLGTTTVVA